MNATPGPPGPHPAQGRTRLLLGALAGAVLLVRLATLGSYPLMDTSEARYGEIARVMLATGDFVTPQEIPGTPFWAKPPLYAWLSAVSMRVFGGNEFALRLPSFLCALGVLVLCFAWARSLTRVRTQIDACDAGLLAIALLACSVLFFVSAGAVMTDPTLALCCTAMLVAFHRTVIQGATAQAWRYGFFVAAGLGMLAKGPVIGLYVGAPIFLWVLWHRHWLALWSRLPWVSGTLLAAAICLPWYALAEAHTPGFLRYFLLGEHIMRFLQPGWGGDKYGTAHAEPLGMIWAYLAGALGLVALPVAAVAGSWCVARWRGARPPGAGAQEQRFLLLAAIVPVAFFTFAGNIIWTYVLPALGPLAVVVAADCAPRMEASAIWRRATLAVLFLAGASITAAVLVWVPRHVRDHSSADLAARWSEREDPAPGELFYLGRKAPASLRFYARGDVVAVADLAQAFEGIAPGRSRYLAIAPPAEAEVIAAARAPARPFMVEKIGSNSDLELLRISDVRAP